MMFKKYMFHWKTISYAVLFDAKASSFRWCIKDMISRYEISSKTTLIIWVVHYNSNPLLFPITFSPSQLAVISQTGLSPNSGILICHFLPEKTSRGWNFIFLVPNVIEENWGHPDTPILLIWLKMMTCVYHWWVAGRAMIQLALVLLTGPPHHNVNQLIIIIWLRIVFFQDCQKCPETCSRI